MGGEKAQSLVSWAVSVGSPPHGRGKVKLPVCQCFGAGITPAWAGKSRLDFYFPQFAKDHPRMGGEKTKKIP